MATPKLNVNPYAVSFGGDPAWNFTAKFAALLGPNRNYPPTLKKRGLDIAISIREPPTKIAVGETPKQVIAKRQQK